MYKQKFLTSGDKPDQRQARKDELEVKIPASDSGYLGLVLALYSLSA